MTAVQHLASDGGSLINFIEVARRVANSTVTNAHAVVFHARRIELESTVVGSVLCDAGRGIPIAEKAGITPQVFGQEDLQLIYTACDLLRNSTLIKVLSLARRALQDEGYWNPKGPIGSTGCSWSNETLEAYARSWFHSATLIETSAYRLIDAIAREAEIRQLQSRIVGLITGEISPKVQPTQQTRVSLRPSRLKQRVA